MSTKEAEDRRTLKDLPDLRQASDSGLQLGELVGVCGGQSGSSGHWRLIRNFDQQRGGEGSGKGEKEETKKMKWRCSAYIAGLGCWRSGNEVAPNRVWTANGFQAIWHLTEIGQGLARAPRVEWSNGICQPNIRLATPRRVQCRVWTAQRRASFTQHLSYLFTRECPWLKTQRK